MYKQTIVVIMPFSKKHAHLAELMVGVLEAKVEVKTIEFTIENISSSINRGCHIITVGRPPEKMRPSAQKLLRSSTHFVWDKYPFNSGFVRPKKVTKFTACVVKRMYSSYRPRLIVVNNPIMKRDFSRGLSTTALGIDVVCAPHPVTQEAIESAKKFESGRNAICDDKWILYDSQTPVSFRNGLGIRSCPWTDTRASDISAPPGAIFNYRREVGCYLVKHGEKLKIAKNFLFDAIRYMKMIRSDHGWSIALKELFSRPATKPLTINQRWKPGTKFAVSVAYGIPLVTPPEASIRYMCETAGDRVYEYYNAKSFDSAISDAFNESRKDMDGKSMDYRAAAELINHSFIKTALL